MTYRYIFRAKKKKFCYHIATPAGTACNMQNSTSYRKLDTLSDEPPLNRMLCAICAHMVGLPPPVRRACDALLGPYPPLTPKQALTPQKLSQGPYDQLLASFGVMVNKNAPDFHAASIRVCQEQYVKLYGKECPNLRYEKARSVLGEIKAHNWAPPPPGMMPMTRPKIVQARKVPKGERKKAKKTKASSRREQIAVTLGKERIEFIVSDAFLSSHEWRRVRYEAIKQNNGCCEACGRGKQHGAVLNVDHILSRRKRPDIALELSNLQVLCHDCNHGKGNWDATDWRIRMPTQTAEERAWEQEHWERFQ